MTLPRPELQIRANLLDHADRGDRNAQCQSDQQEDRCRVKGGVEPQSRGRRRAPRRPRPRDPCSRTPRRRAAPWAPRRTRILPDRSPDRARTTTLTRPHIRVLAPYAANGAPESVVCEARWAARDEARWTGYTALIIASANRSRPNGHEGNRTTSVDRAWPAGSPGTPWSEAPPSAGSSPLPRRRPGWKKV